MNRNLVTTALAVLLASGLTLATHAQAQQSDSEARQAFNAALDKCEEMSKDQRETCSYEAMNQYRLAREKEKAN